MIEPSRRAPGSEVMAQAGRRIENRRILREKSCSRRLEVAAIMAACLFLVTNAVAMGTRSLLVGARIDPIKLRATDGQTRLWEPGFPTAFVIWASWSPLSQAALHDIITSVPQSGIKWDIVPINVDRPLLHSRQKIETAARKAGYTGRVWFDDGLELFSEWGILTVPTVIITGLGGTVEAVEDGWSAQIRERVVPSYFGILTDTTRRAHVDTAAQRCRLQVILARDMSAYGKLDSAVALLERARTVCPRLIDVPVLEAFYHWEMHDTSGTRAAAMEVVRADSNDGWGWMLQSALLMRSGTYDSTRLLAARALTADSCSAPAWKLFAQASLELGDTAGARLATGRLDGLDRFDADLEIVRARILEGEGSREEAMKSWRLAAENGLRQRRQALRRRTAASLLAGAGRRP